jgi:hypothetical protein
MGTVRIEVNPTDLPPDEVIELSFEGDAFDQSVFVLENGLYQPAQSSYTIGQMPDTFYIHGHTISTALRDRTFAAQHPPSEARDRIKLTVFDVDLDIDSDNNNAVKPPARSVYEDSIEEKGDTANPYGKIVFANHNDDDRDEIPDYSDLEVLASSALGSKDEGQFVPVVLQVRPPFLNWSSAKVKITYDAKPDLPSIAAFNGTDVGNGFKDYRQVKIGAMRLWKVDHPYENRNASKYVKPDSQYAASWFGLDSGEHKRQLLLEGINQTLNSTATLHVEIPGVLTGVDKVRISVLEPNLGLNCNQNLNNADGIRVGISDVLWEIDENDEVVEDQRGTDKRYGVNFWWGRDPGPTITKPGIVDLMPFMINVPPELIDMGFTFCLKIDSSLVRVYKAASPSDERLFFLQDTDLESHETPTADAQIALQNTHVLISGTPAYLPLTAGTNELVFRAVGGSFDDKSLGVVIRH